MANGIVDIPLPGRPLGPADQDGGAVSPCHFVAGPENRLVDVAVRSMLDEPVIGYNPLVLYGPSGTGKSHVAGGLAELWKARNRRQRVVSTMAVDFARELADAIESQAVEEFRTKYRTANLLVFEDLGQLATRRSGKLSAQEELIHTLDALLAEERWAIVTASASPAELPGLLPALQSRLAAGLTIPLAPPGPEARLTVLRQLAGLREIELPESVARVLAEGLGGTVPELAGALMQLAMPADFGADPIDLHTAKQYLVERNHRAQPTLREIALATSRHFSLKLSDLRSPTRRRALVTARGVAIYLARRFSGKSFQEIGQYLGGRDHTTVMHGFQRTEQMIATDAAIHEAIEHLHGELWKT